MQFAIWNVGDEAICVAGLTQGVVLAGKDQCRHFDIAVIDRVAFAPIPGDEATILGKVVSVLRKV